jgi:hypothetical protein
LIRQTSEEGRTSVIEADAAQMQLFEARAELTKIELRARYLLGGDGTEAAKSPAAPEEGESDFGPSPPARAVLEALEADAYTEAWSGKLFEQVLRQLQKSTRFTIIVDSDIKGKGFMATAIPEGVFPMTMRLRAALQALSDIMNNETVFVVRDYGLLVTSHLKAASKGYAPTIPPINSRSPR